MSALSDPAAAPAEQVGWSRSDPLSLKDTARRVGKRTGRIEALTQRANGGSGRRSRGVNRQDGGSLTERRGRAARSGVVGTLCGRTAPGRASWGGTAPDIQPSALCRSCATFGPGREGGLAAIPVAALLCRRTGVAESRGGLRAGREKRAQRVWCAGGFIAAEQFPGTGCAGWLGRGARTHRTVRA